MNASRAATLEREISTDYTPTPDEIRAACAAIQARWSPTERAARQVHPTGYVHFSKIVDPERLSRGFLDPDRAE